MDAFRDPQDIQGSCLVAFSPRRNIRLQGQSENHTEAPWKPPSGKLIHVCRLNVQTERGSVVAEGRASAERKRWCDDSKVQPHRTRDNDRVWGPGHSTAPAVNSAVLRTGLFPQRVGFRHASHPHEKKEMIL